MYLAARGWGLQPSEFWAMTASELVCEAMVRGDGEKYAGGMTSGDLEDIKAQSAALREKRAAARRQANGA